MVFIFLCLISLSILFRSIHIYVYTSIYTYIWMDFPGGTNGKEPVFQCRRLKRHSFDPGPGRSPGAGHVNTFQYSCLENSMDRGDWCAAAHRVAKSWT